MTTTSQVFSAAGERGFIRPLNPRRDLLVVADLIELCFRETMDQNGLQHLSQMRDFARGLQIMDWAFWMAEQSAKSPLSGYVWEQDGRVVGNVSLLSHEIENHRTYLIANVAVHPDQRGRGIGRALTAAAVDYAAQRQMHSVWLQVSADNPSALHIYQSLGFLERARRTLWATDRSALPTLPAEDLPVGERLAGYWPQQRAWLAVLYPPLLRWNVSPPLSLLQPGLWGALQRFFSFEFPRQWAFAPGGRLQAVLTWLDAVPDRPNLWLAAPETLEPAALRALLVAARRRLGPRRSLCLNLPADLGQEVLLEFGFQARQTLITMEKTLA